MSDIKPTSVGSRIGMVLFMVVAAAIAATLVTMPKAYADRPEGPSLGNFVDHPECTVRTDPDGGVMVDIVGKWGANTRTAELAPRVTPAPPLMAPTMSLVVNEVVQTSMTIPPSNKVSDVRLTLRRLSTLWPSYIYTKWQDDTWDHTPYLFASLAPTGAFAECIISTN